MTRLILMATVFMPVSGPVGAKDGKGRYAIQGNISCTTYLYQRSLIKTHGPIFAVR